MTYPMSTVAHALLQSQEIAHKAACAERELLQHPEHDTPWNRAQIADGYAAARQYAANFAIGANLHRAANDETCTPETA